jgi:predicted deacetylase
LPTTTKESTGRLNIHIKKVGIITIHDVTSINDLLSKTTETIKRLEALEVKYNIAIVPNYLKKFSITTDNFTNVISQYLERDRPNIALHGLYHEYRHYIEDFHTLTTRETKEEIAKGVSILNRANLPDPKAFIPPAWYVSPSTLEALQEMGFEMAESMDRIDLIQKEIAIVTQQVMNWDVTGDAQQNKQTVKQNQEIYDRIMRGFKPNILRIALHPPHDPPEALDQQLEIIRGLKEEADYTFKTYHDFIEEDIYGHRIG